jgi:carbon monoxide dehydrogenase subunit G
MARYRFLTTWLLEAPRQDCWDVLQDVTSWPRWWPGVSSVEQVTPGDSRRVGSVHRVRWRALVAYSVELDFRVEEVREPALMSGRSSGELEGTGTWRLMEQDGVTAVLYDWDVRTTRAWMNALAPAARPLFALSHDRIMREGGEGLARRLGVRLLAAS